MEYPQPKLRLQLLGLPCVVQYGAEVPLAENRPIQLLAHLAVRRSWQSRDELARLFWPERTKKIAHSNLRNLLCKTFAAAPFAAIEATEHALRLRVQSDLDDFDAALQRSDWETAVRLGAADLLQGYEGNATEPYQHWLQGEREAMLAQWTHAVQALLAQSARPPEQRQALAESWALRCPYDEEAVHARMAIAFERRQAGSAATIFRAFEARLQVEFGVRPSRALECFALEEAPSTGPDDTPLAPRPALSTLAPGPGRQRLFGRRLELGQLKSLLADNAIRLITLTGPGGVGKSTLIAALHEQCVAEGRADTCLVDASAAHTAQAVIAAIAVALGIEGLQGEANEVALAATLRDRRSVLMIDGAEQPGLAAPLALLLDRCPQTRLLIASRSRLQLENERVLVLDGFPQPDSEETDTEVLGNNDGVRYFVEMMSQAGQAANLSHDAGPLAALVQAVEGLPLALKLLAQLTRMFSLPQLLDSVHEQMLGVRQAGSPALGELMPALVASFERSWRALSPAEQAVLARLAVFPAAFDVAAARAVAGTELPLITSLVDRSLVRAAGAGRLSLHAGIRACVLAACPLSDSVSAAYLEFYAQRLATLAGLAKVKSVRPLNQFLRDEGPHVEHAWRLALERRAYPALLSLTESLVYQVQGDSSGGDYGAWFVEAGHLLRDDRDTPMRLQAMLLTAGARAACFQRREELAEGQARAALRAAQRARHREAIYLSLATLSMVCVVQGRLREAEAMIERAQALSSEIGEAYPNASLLRVRVQVSFERGDLETALQLADELVLICRRFEDSDAVVRMLTNKICFCTSAGDKLLASKFLDQVIESASASDVNPALELYALVQASLNCLYLEDHARARACIDRANAIAFGFPQAKVEHLGLQAANAAVEVMAGELAPAAPRLVEVLGEIGRGDAQSLVSNTFMFSAMWFRSVGDRKACLDMLRAGPAAYSNTQTFREAQSMLRELGEEAHQQDEAARRASVIEITELATIARRRMLVRLDEMRRSKPL